MKKILVLLVVIFSLNVFAGYYKVYFKNGGLLLLKEKPDFTKEKVIGITLDGEKIIFRRTIVDLKKTEQENNAKKEVKRDKKVVKPEKKSKDNVVFISSSTKSTKPPLIITEATVGKKKEDKDKKKQTSFMEWKNHPMSGERVAGDSSEGIDYTKMNEKEARKYWRARFEAVNKAIKDTETGIKKIQEKLNMLLSQKLNTDETMVILQINQEMEKLEKKKKQLENNLIKLKKSKEDLKEEARKAGALPGWYRDLL